MIFERTPAPDDGSPTTLQMIDDVSNPNPVAVPVGLGAGLTNAARLVLGDRQIQRPVQRRQPATASHPSASIWRVGSNGANPTLISGTTGAYYPKWNLEGTLFVTENDGGTPSPCNTIFTLEGVAQTANIDGVDSGQRVPIFGGMPAVMSTDLPQIAYAGQPMLATGTAPTRRSNTARTTTTSSSTQQTPNGIISSSAGIGRLGQRPSIRKYEGRAPDISPDGTMIVFESNRPNGGTNYSIYLYSRKNSSVTQVTVSGLNCQHAKFFPCGTKLILGAQNPTWNIGWVDISSLL